MVEGKHGFSLDLTEFPWGCAYYTKHGRMMAADAYDRLSEFPVIYFGAVGDPSVPDHVAVWELILPLRQRFDQYVNLRPMPAALERGSSPGQQKGNGDHGREYTTVR